MTMREFLTSPVLVGLFFGALGYAVGVMAGVICERDRQTALQEEARRQAAVQPDAIAAAWAVRKGGGA
jgi:uncharacterized membrane protein